MVRILTVQRDDDLATFFGFYEKDGTYYEFAIDREWPYTRLIALDFENCDEFEIFIAKCKPWVKFWREPVEVEALTYATLEGITRIEHKNKMQPETGTDLRSRYGSRGDGQRTVAS